MSSTRHDLCFELALLASAVHAFEVSADDSRDSSTDHPTAGDRLSEVRYVRAGRDARKGYDQRRALTAVCNPNLVGDGFLLKLLTMNLVPLRHRKDSLCAAANDGLIFREVRRERKRALVIGD